MGRVTARQWMVLEHNGVMWITFQVLAKTWCLQRDSPTIPGLMRLVLLLLKEVLFVQLWLLLLTMSMLLWLLPLLIMSIFLLQNMSMSLLLPLLPMSTLLDNITQRFLKDPMIPSLRLLVWRLQPNRM